MKRKKSLYVLIIAVAVISLSMLSSLFLLDDVMAERFVSVITAITAVIGATALFYQFKRDKNLNEATFLVEYSQQFYATYDCAELMNELEKCRADKTYRLDTERYYQKIVAYLEWLETLASLINSNVLEIPTIDDVLSYRYFLIVNNRQIQDCELVRFWEFYR